MKRLFFILLFFYCTNLFSQEANPELNQKNIYRVVASFPIPTVNFQYESALTSEISLLLKTGLNFTLASSAALNRDKVRSQISWITSIESRFYYNLKHRITKGKSTKNFSAWHIGLEPYYRSNSIAAINEVKQVNNGSVGAFINLGFQKQSEKNIYNAFFIGVAPIATRLGAINTTTGKLYRVWLNFSIGYVFK